MNKKGFTLVELLTVIALLAIFALVTIPAVDNILKKQKTKIYQQNIETIKDALKLLNNEIEIDDGDEYQLTLGDLKDEGLIDPNFKNPLTKKLYSNNSRLSITRIGEQYKYNVVSLFDAGESENSNPVEPQINYAFRQIGACTFNGNSNITGNGCTNYTNSKFIDTHISLFGATTYQTDFDISFDIDSFAVANQTIEQATLISAMWEVDGTSLAGFLLRTRNDGTDLQLVLRKNGRSGRGEASISSIGLERLRFVRKDGRFCYSVNDGPLTYVYDYRNLSNTFDLPLYFGATTDSNDAPGRYINGILSNISIRLEVDPEVVCTDS